MANKLIGNRPNQVPTNADLGTAAFLDSDNFAKKNLTGTIDGYQRKLQLTADSSSRAQKVFIYDTRLDSDGGAWRKRCGHTSWYNEKLNTPVRGSRREFPQVAIIADTGAVDEQIVIYDGDDPNLPMWMVFTRQGSWNTSGFGGARDVTAIHAKNGLIAVGKTPYGYHSVNFISENIQFREDGYFRYLYGGIADRNNNLVTSEDMGSSGDLLSDTITDIHMEVFDYAPIDPETGLPNPTVAISCTGGLNIINYDNVVSKITSSGGANYNNVVEAQLYKNGDVVWGQDGSGGSRPLFRINLRNHPSLGNTISYESIVNDGNPQDKDASANHLAGLPVPYGGDYAGTAKYRRYKHLIWSTAVSETGFNILEQQPNSYQKNGYVASIGKDWNTGYKAPDTMIATLCDTIRKPLNPANEQARGQILETNKSLWSFVGGCGVSTNSSFFYPGTDQSSVFTLSGAGGTNYCQSPTFGVNAGESYVISMLVKENGSGTGGLNLEWYVYDGDGTTVSGFAPSWPLVNSANKWTYVSRIVTFSKTGSGAYIRIGADDNEQFYVDSVTMAPVIKNYATVYEGLYGQHHQQIGYLTKTPVAAGAELLGWSGWSSSNYVYIHPSYLTEMTNATISFWYKGNSGHIFGAYDKGTGDDCRVEFTSNQLRWAWTDTVATAYTMQCLDPDVSSVDRWHHAVCVKNGGRLILYKDGRKVNEAVNTNFEGTEPCRREIVIGARPDNFTENFNGEIALFRLSTSAKLTDQQIMAMYQDESKLFQRNAKCTLAGTSNSVTRCTFDEQTQTAHVIHQYHRSDFQGLVRVGETRHETTVVNISAVNGLILES